MKVRFIIVLFCFFMVFFSSFAQASSHALTVRQLPNNEYEAVVTFSNQDYCFVVAYQPSSIQVIEYDVLITSPGPDGITCIGKAPPELLHETTAFLGELRPGKYAATWNQDRSFSLTTSFEVKGYSPIPSSSLWSLLVLAFGVLVVVRFTLRSRHSTAPS